MIRKFRTDQDYLAKYHERMSAVLLFLNAGLVFMFVPDLQNVLWYLPCLLLLSSPQVTTVLTGFAYALGAGILSQDFSWIQLLAIPAAVLITFPITALLHCASHDSLRPRWLNRPVGELMGLVQLYGFPDWKVLHYIHHSHTDDAELDPHPPLNRSYWEFTKGMRSAASAAFLKHYFKHFEQTPASMKSALRFSRAARINTVMKLVFWFLLLGHQCFAFLFVTSLAFKMLHYSWLNHSTHRPGAQDGEAEIQNLNHGWIYPVINSLAFGLYFHKNHHLAPALFNPRHFGGARKGTKPNLGEMNGAA